MKSHDLRRVLLLPGLALVASVTVAATRSPKLPCEVAVEWVQAHKADLPRTYSSLAPYSPLYRKAIYAELTAPERIAIWRTRLETFAADSSALTSTQRTMINEVMARLPVYLNGAEGRRAIKQEGLGRRLRAVFGDSLTAVIFTQIGPDAAADPRSVNGAAALSKALSQGECDCNDSSSFSCFGGTCTLLSGQMCIVMITGCGLFGCEVCNGVCFRH